MKDVHRAILLIAMLVTAGVFAAPLGAFVGDGIRGAQDQRGHVMVFK
jgi:hypothetical protein